MEKFSQIPYVRPDADAVKASLRRTAEEMRKSESYEQMRDLYLEAQKELQGWETMNTVANIRNTVDTNDVFYEQEMQFLNEENPNLILLVQEMEKVILECPWREQWEKEYGTFFWKNMEINQKLADESVVPEMVEESNLT